MGMERGWRFPGWTQVPSALTGEVGNGVERQAQERPRHFLGIYSMLALLFLKSSQQPEHQHISHMEKLGFGFTTLAPSGPRFKLMNLFYRCLPSYLCLTWRGAETAWAFQGPSCLNLKDPFIPSCPRWD